MKKLITWLTKGSKVSRILKYIYKALIIAKSTVNGAADGTAEAEISDKIVEKISTAGRYIDVATKYLAIIMSWFGISAEERDVLASEALSPEEIERNCNEIIG